MITLCGLSLSNQDNKVKTVLREKGIPFTEAPVPTGSSDRAVLNATPLGKLPFLKVDGRTLCESQVIVDFLGARSPAHPLLPAGPLAAAEVRERCAFMAPYIERVGRGLYAAAYFGGTLGDASKERVKRALPRNLPAFQRLARFAPYVAGDSFTLADASAFATLPTAGNAARAIHGEDLAAAGIDWKPWPKMLGKRPSLQRVNADRQRDTEALAAAAARRTTP